MNYAFKALYVIAFIASFSIFEQQTNLFRIKRYNINALSTEQLDTHID